MTKFDYEIDDFMKQFIYVFYKALVFIHKTSIWLYEIMISNTYKLNIL